MWTCVRSRLPHRRTVDEQRCSDSVYALVVLERRGLSGEVCEMQQRVLMLCAVALFTISRLFLYFSVRPPVTKDDRDSLCVS